ncbi:DUF3050 domain-containing protein [Flavobacterium oreochromis]|uniref:Heme oxygenase n=2 Tax=Flavobacterium TaxID=237 RepID=A0A246GDC9_9FLAO|nr:DUF3050 domain-containing protein [Flavobacterium oreochromis]OWP78549.1 heme oxygenase [Flavobacterium oreochromis]OWP79283.1 heme oxygenase [Flavobacterium oreochromis]POR25350.1 heme oxygenase [Flavobacterium columnare]QYS87003.1 DUF3050 domain-containing protein [Flavobacterium oreochromis]
MSIESIHKNIQTQKDILLNHPLYPKIKTLESLNIFLEHHIYAVWDFMSLLKALQNQLTCTSTPWKASPNPETRYLINEIVLAEESDLALDGKRLSHYEMYLEAMQDCGASTNEIKSFLKNVDETRNIFVSINQSELGKAIKDFLTFTFKVIEKGQPHEIASAFTFGREDLIPSMFTAILKNFKESFPEKDFSKLIYYFERHIELDGDEHGPMAMKMIEYLANDDQEKWNEMEKIAIEALEKRIQLWNAIEESIDSIQ